MAHDGLSVCSPIKLIQEYSCTEVVRSYYWYPFGIHLTSKNIKRKPNNYALKNSEMKRIAERIQEIMRLYNNQNRKPNHTTAPERH